MSVPSPATAPLEALARQSGHSPTAIPRGAVRLTLIIALVGVIVTAALAWTAWRVDRSNEHRLLQVQTKQAATVVASAIVSLQVPLQTARDIATASDGDVGEFTKFMSAYIGPSALFVSASLWKTTSAEPSEVTVLGNELAGSSAKTALVTRASHSPTFVVGGFSAASAQGVGYALADSKAPTYSVYAERTIPANRRVPVESDSAFADLHFATYLGPTTSLAALQTTDEPVAKLPIGGDSVREEIPFGDTTLTLVTAPIGHLGGSIGSKLPWIIVIAGALVTGAAVAIAARLVRRRRNAERDASTITELYERLDRSFGEQRTISETLQRALLPQRNPVIPQLEIASRYVAGAHGVDIGGDWYSIIQLEDNRFGFVVGDVSGRGINAATHMARVRFTLRAYLIEGHRPNVALDLSTRQLDLQADGHFTTVLIGVGDLAAGTITLANAGHLNPVVLSGDTATVVTTAVGPPLGIAHAGYETVTIPIAAGSTFIAFTDGLVERRHEDLDVGVQRLVDTVQRSAGAGVDDLLTEVLERMEGAGAADDIAVLAFRWGSPVAAVASGD